MIVVDASVAMKWFLNDQDSSQALGLFHQSYKLVAPELIRIEVLAAIDFTKIWHRHDHQRRYDKL